MPGKTRPKINEILFWDGFKNKNEAGNSMLATTLTDV